MFQNIYGQEGIDGNHHHTQPHIEADADTARDHRGRCREHRTDRAPTQHREGNRKDIPEDDVRNVGCSHPYAGRPQGVASRHLHPGFLRSTASLAVRI